VDVGTYTEKVVVYYGFSVGEGGSCNFYKARYDKNELGSFELHSSKRMYRFASAVNRFASIVVVA
jgi:hypothetical protein